MHRRRFLALAAGGGLAGCAGLAPGRTSPPAAGNDGVESVAGTDLPVPERRLKRSVGRDDIPAIVDPAFGEGWEGLELEVPYLFGETTVIRPELVDSDRVVGVERGGEARAYPLALLNWHEVVNDRLGGPLLVTYCPLCRSAVVARREVRGREAVFGVSGLLWRSNLVLYDRPTDSLWSQVAATAIRGPATGGTLDLLPSTITTWGAWREAHPDTGVLLPPPASNTVRGRDAVRNYTIDPYRHYEASGGAGPGSTFDDDRLHPKALVIGVAAGGEARAYPVWAVREHGPLNDAVGGRPVVVAATPGGSLAAYDRRVDGTTVEFDPAGDRYLRAGGSRWRRATGRAVDGPHEGTTLAAASELPPLYWFSWLEVHPDSTLFDPAGD